MIYFIFVILLILVLIILYLLNIIIEITKAYEKLERDYTAIFVAFRKRREHIELNYQRDLELISYYQDIHHKELNERLLIELNMPIIDDESKYYRDEAIKAIDTYNITYKEYIKKASKYPLICKLLALDKYCLLDIDIDPLTAMISYRKEDKA